MTIKRLIQIVPRRSRIPEGVGDYSRLMAEELKRSHGVETHFISGTQLPLEEQLDDEWPTTTVEKRSAACLVDVLNQLNADDPQTSVLIHLSGYGYQNRGVPFWLLKGIDQWRIQSSAQFATVFHEIRAHGKPWQSSFYLGFLQEKIARSFASLSSFCITPSLFYQKQISEFTGSEKQKKILQVPVPSNVGELGRNLAFEGREKQVVVFGGAMARAQVYDVAKPLFANLARNHGIERVVDVGREVASSPDQISGLPIVKMGMLPAKDVSACLSKSVAGILPYDARRLGKSTIFAAYASHGVAPICLSSNSAGDGLAHGSNIIVIDENSDQSVHGNLCFVGEAAFRWYQPHSLQNQVVELMKHLNLAETTK